MDTTNPKDAAGEAKAPLYLVPPILVIQAADAMAEGAKKYGPYNWRATRVRATVYISAMLRHLAAYADGENVTEDCIHHLAHVAASCAILLDAEALDQLIDDRPTNGPAPGVLADYEPLP